MENRDYIRSLATKYGLKITDQFDDIILYMDEDVEKMSDILSYNVNKDYCLMRTDLSYHPAREKIVSIGAMSLDMFKKDQIEKQIQKLIKQKNKILLDLKLCSISQMCNK